MASFAMNSLIGLVAFILLNACRQLLFRSKTEPPAVFHWIPYIGNAVSYGTNPVAFFEKYREKVRTMSCFPTRIRVADLKQVW